MKQWQYQTIYLVLQTIKHSKEKHEDYVVTFSDGSNIEGLEMIMRHYLDDEGWELLSMVPTGFHHTTRENIIADELTAIFRREFSF